MPIHWQTLIAQVAVVIVAATLWGHIGYHLRFSSRTMRRSVLGCIMGMAATVLIVMPITVRSGVLVDLRAAPVLIAGLFGGPLAGLLAAATAFVSLWCLSDSGIVGGCLVTGVAGGLACVVGLRVTNREIRNTDIAVAASAGLVGIVIASVVFESVMVQAAQHSLLTDMSLALMTCVATLLGGLTIVQDQQSRALLSANLMYGAIIESLPDCLHANDTDGRFLAANPATARLMKVAHASDLLGKTDFDLYPYQIAKQCQADAIDAIYTGKVQTVERHVIFSDGKDAWLSILKAPFRDKAGTLIGSITHSRDITEQKRLRDEFAAMKQLLEYSMQNMTAGLVMYDSHGTILLSNQRHRDLFPLTADLRVPGVHLTDVLRAAVARGEEIIKGDAVDNWVNRIYINLKKPEARVFKLSDGRHIEVHTQPLDNGGVLQLMTDVTERQQAEEVLTQANNHLALLARTDSLTGLMNRRGFDETLAREMARGFGRKTVLGLLMIDVDCFKSYNDTYGHPAGDACLRKLGEAINNALYRASGIAARYGGEEFAVILPNSSPSEALDIAEAIREAARSLNIRHSGSTTGSVTVSVGAGMSASSSDVDHGSAMLIERADQALYKAKQAGRDRVCIVTTSSLDDMQPSPDDAAVVGGCDRRLWRDRHGHAGGVRRPFGEPSVEGDWQRAV